jgi:hypothetical protein
LDTFSQLDASNDVKKVKEDLDKLSEGEKETGKGQKIRRIRRPGQ